MVYNRTMKNKNLVYQILIVFVLVSVVTNTVCLFIRNSVIGQEKLKAEYAVNSTIDRVEVQLEAYIQKVNFLKKTIEAGIDLDDAYFKSIASVSIPIAKVLIGFFKISAAIAHTRLESRPPDNKNPSGASASRRFFTPSVSLSWMFFVITSISSCT